MAEQRIAERIDANLMDLTMDELRHLPKITYDEVARNSKHQEQVDRKSIQPRQRA